MNLRQLLHSLVADEAARSELARDPSAVLERAGFEGIGDDLLGTALIHYADRADPAEFDHLDELLTRFVTSSELDAPETTIDPADPVHLDEVTEIGQAPDPDEDDHDGIRDHEGGSDEASRESGFGRGADTPATGDPTGVTVPTSGHSTEPISGGMPDATLQDPVDALFEMTDQAGDTPVATDNDLLHDPGDLDGLA